MNDFVATESELDDEQINRPKLSYKKKNGRHRRTRTPPEVSSATDEGLALEMPEVNPDGGKWGDEEPYCRPKLSYGGGLASASKRGSGVFDSVSGMSSSGR